MARLFLAVDLPEALRASLGALAVPMAGARWVAPEQMHLTLRFLGWVPDPAIPQLESTLGTVSAPAFAGALSGVGVFPGPPSRKPARVLWAGITPVAPFVALKTAIDAALGPDPEDRPYSPHLTLARFKERPGPELGRLLERHQTLASEPWPVDAFHLYESRLRSTGALYGIVRSFALRRDQPRAGRAHRAEAAGASYNRRR